MNPEIIAYEKLLFQGKSADAFLAAHLSESEASFSKAIALSKELQPMIDEVLVEYRKIFPRANYSYKVLLLPSFVFDGRAEELSDGTILLAFGIDRLSRYRKENLKVVIAHEMFHAIQMQSVRAKTLKSMALTDVWQEVWVEGLATYASGVILGLKSAPDVLGKKNIEVCKTDLLKEKAILLSNFERKTAEIPDLMNKWFGGNQFAYCMGYLAIAEIAKEESLAKLLEWELVPSTRLKLFEKVAAISEIN